jgi:putative aldouronate transport system permease protein
MHRKKPEGKLFNIINGVLLSIYAFICFYPFYYIFLYSLSDPTEANIRGVWLLPAGFSLANYKKIFMTSDLINAVFISASRAVVGTIITILCCCFLGYLVSKKEMFLRKTVYRFTVLTMYVSAGLIPWYITMKTLGLKDNYFLYVLPSAVVAFYVVLIKTYIEQIPPSLEESAMLDGAGYFTIFTRIVFPLCTPVIATVAIYSAVNQWNAWQDNLFLVSNPKLSTLQLLLFNVLTNDTFANGIAGGGMDSILSKKNLTTPMSIKMTMSMVTVVPILIVYPALQRFFIKGIMLGAIKG